MPIPEVRKQISIFVPVSDWKLLRHAAASRQIPITELCRQWLAPAMQELRAESPPQAAKK